MLAGSELNEHPLHPISVWAHRQIAEHGDATPVGWQHRIERFGNPDFCAQGPLPNLS